jgi:hypothetical protein
LEADLKRWEGHTIVPEALSLVNDYFYVAFEFLQDITVIHLHGEWEDPYGGELGRSRRYFREEMRKQGWKMKFVERADSVGDESEQSNSDIAEEDSESDSGGSA